MLESARLANDIATAIATVGWIVTDSVVSSSDVNRAVEAITPHQNTASDRGGVRNLFELPEVTSLAQSSDVRAVAEAVLGADCVAVKATLFDKTPHANWKVSWHQDVTISVRERRLVAGFGAWSQKDGTPHVQPPARVLEGMLAVRIHLDDCGLDNGPVRVIPGSHLAGRLSGAEIDVWRAKSTFVACVAARGAILAFRPLLLHASSAASTPGHRRVVHVEYAAAGILPDGLAWANEVGPCNRAVEQAVATDERTNLHQ